SSTAISGVPWRWRPLWRTCAPFGKARAQCTTSKARSGADFLLWWVGKPRREGQRAGPYRSSPGDAEQSAAAEGKQYTPRGQGKDCAKYPVETGVAPHTWRNLLPLQTSTAYNICPFTPLMIEALRRGNADSADWRHSYPLRHQRSGRATAPHHGVSRQRFD